MEEKKELHLMTRDDFRNAAAKHGFARVRDGVYEDSDRILKDTARQLTQAGMIQATHNHHSGLGTREGLAAVSVVKAIPPGVYHTETKKKASRAQSAKAQQSEQ